ncbi:ATP-dependent DNA helicase DinG [Tamilnaduibacter salinus]|uniref:ATP-dependent DNA helicase DinG n=1 Tax=Tamilnaduibacter salinus TaxID=1484056 RepID=A0A2A2I7A9_9GAMM|nr:ATP-dependent DNA helicase DinG [Tamilnaduibacter salinus]PAV27000.1 ATP-dependent DNA helicase DinG [Tamilnaduibacter salinus]
MKALSEEVKQQIQQAYRDVLAGKSIRARYGQRLMIAEIARYLGGITSDGDERTSPPSACVVEAGTGTGKTLAYLMAAIPMAQALGKKLVISTATVALQDQIVQKDLPDVRQHASLDFNWTLAKGRGRYLCLSRLEGRLHDEGNTESETMPLELLEGRGDEDSGDTREFLEYMLSSYASGHWDGDRDHWPEPITDETWRRVTTDHRQCTNRHCSYFDSCAFFKARDGLEDTDVIVANHDLVLADLALGGGAILPKPEDAIYIFDEAHHLPEKALGHFAASVSLGGTRSWLKQLSQILTKLQPWLAPDSQAAKTVTRISDAARDLDPILQRVLDDITGNTDWENADDRGNGRWRYPDGELPEVLAGLADEAATATATLTRQLDALVDEFQKGFDENREHDVDRETAENWYPVAGTLHARAEDQLRLWSAWREDRSGDGPPSARWVVRQVYDQAEDITLYSSPVMASGLLQSRLWSRAWAAILTSATLTALGRFDRLKARAGLPEESHYLVVPSAFRYDEMATVEVPAMTAMPNDTEAFTDELVAKLPGIWEDHQAVLVLFTSRKQMRTVHERLSPDWPGRITTQDDYARAEVLRRHRERIDAGQPSVLFGVASFAEGIDLPGEYLEHVVITRLPFSVPDDPIEASLSEWVQSQGRNPFMEITVPDASIKLVQAAGRLLRKEDDQGRITILDRRIVTRRYGQLLLDALPPFRRVIE